MKIYENYSLLPNNTFGINAKCWQFVEVETSQEAAEKLPFIVKSTKPTIVIGGGSNLLLTQDYDGIVVHSAIKGISISSPSSVNCPTEGTHAEESTSGSSKADGSSFPSFVFLKAGSGECFDDVVATAVSLGYYGMENLSIIPGDVGASAVQNIGAYGVEAKDIIHSIDAVEIASGKKMTIMNSECDYAYRQSRFKKEWKGKYFITAVTYKLQTEYTPHIEYGGIKKALEERGIAEPTAQDVRDTIIAIRNAKLPDPKVLGNGGSFFMNPVVSREKFEQLLAEYPTMPHYYIDADHEKIPAGWMIEQCGWKGKSLGKAAVHDKQALVLVNLGGASGSEIVALCEQVRKDVMEKFGIDIHPEVNII